VFIHRSAIPDGGRDHIPPAIANSLEVAEVNVRCGMCGADVAEGQPVCPSCGAAVRQAGDELEALAGFGPGTSAGGASGSSGDGLPSWLQNFAASAGASGSDSAAGDAPSLPGWIESPRPEPTPELHQAASSPAPRRPEPAFTPRTPVGDQLELGGGGNFFSEDDLPEWLRALNADAAQDRPVAVAVDGAQPLAPVAGGSSPAAVGVPTVTSVWVTGHDGPLQSSSASVFAAVASTVEERPEVVAHEPVRERLAVSEGARVPTIPAAAEVMPRREWGRFRLYMFAAVLIVFLLLVIYTTQQ
jgi:hypothetical protein